MKKQQWILSDKERLEMIKGIQKRIKECQEKGRDVSNLHSDYVDWLIEQAERVQELEEENKRYREALERIKDNVPLEFKHNSEYEAKKNVIRLINIQNEVDEALEGEE